MELVRPEATVVLSGMGHNLAFPGAVKSLFSGELGGRGEEPTERRDLNSQGRRLCKVACFGEETMRCVVPLPLDTGCILNGTAERRWRGEREQPESKCCSLSVLKCSSWISGKSISLAQVSEGYLGFAVSLGNQPAARKGGLEMHVGVRKKS